MHLNIVFCNIENITIFVLQMDSGSPLVIDNILIGIQSCAPGVSPGKKQLPIFTRVFPYISWINRETGEERPDSEVYSSKIIFT